MYFPKQVCISPKSVVRIHGEGGLVGGQVMTEALLPLSNITFSTPLMLIPGTFNAPRTLYLRKGLSLPV
jgi:hypothetical protein